MHKNPLSSGKYVKNLRVDKRTSSVVIPSDNEADSEDDNVEENPGEGTHVHDIYDVDKNFDIPHEEPTGSVQQLIGSVSAAPSYEETFMRSID